MSNYVSRGQKPVHFIGIGGIGMSALARYYKTQKWAVSGSDLASSDITRELTKEGVMVKIGHKKGNLGPKTGLVIYSQAIKADNPELKETRRLGIPALSYPEVIGELTKKYKTIAVAGAHGKSTTTALTALILKKAGLDPMVIVGTKLRELDGKNFRSGKSDWLVLEADEFGKAFLRYSPAIAIVTNIDREHLDTYKNLAGVKSAFLKFLSRTDYGGVLVLNKDDKNLFSLRSRIAHTAKRKSLLVRWYSRNIRADSRKIRGTIKIPGEHNLSNALAAYSLGRVLKIPEKKILSAIGSYRGSWRRMEYRGRCQVSGVRCQVFDDYAHHPTEIKATLAAFLEKFPKSKIICVFQPHQAKRLAGLFKEFQHAFDLADITLVLPTYKVAGREKGKRREEGGRSAAALVRAIQKREPKKSVFYLKNPKKIKAALSALLGIASPLLRKSASSRRQSAVLVMMGAGDIVNYTGRLLSRRQ